MALHNSKYKPEFCERLLAHLADGFSFNSFGGEVNVSRETLYQWEKKYPDFAHAKNIGTLKGMKWWETLGRGGAAGRVPGFNPAAWIFTMKNRFGWRDKIEHSGDIDASNTSAKLKNLMSNPKTADAARIVALAMSADDKPDGE